MILVIQFELFNFSRFIDSWEILYVKFLNLVTFFWKWEKNYHLGEKFDQKRILEYWKIKNYKILFFIMTFLYNLKDNVR